MLNLVPGAKIAVAPADHMGRNVWPGVDAQRMGGGFPTVNAVDWHANTTFLSD
jgi:hypothetical protein